MMDNLEDKIAQWLLTEAALPLLLVDARGAIVLSNPAAQALFGYAEAELKGLPVESLMPERYRQKHQQAHAGYLHSPQKRPMNNGLTLPAQHRDGHEFMVEISLTPVRDGLVMATIQDVTRHRLAMEALQQHQARLEQTEAIAHLGSWELNLASQRLTWSDEVYRIFGLPPQGFEATYEAFLERVHPDDRAAVDKAYTDSLLEDRDTYEIEHRIVRQDNGETRCVHEKCQHFRDDTGRIVHSVGMIHDITERKQAEAALQQSEAALKEAQRLAGLGNWKWDLRSDSHTWSEEIYHLYGRDPALPPAVYPEVKQYFTAASWDRLAATVEKALAEGVSYECDAEVVRPDGSRRWVLARGTAARDASGTIIDLHGTVQDITARKQTEEALRESERRYRELVQNANSAIIRWSRDGTLTFFNEYAQVFFGWSADEAVGRHVSILLPERESTGADLSGLIQDIVDHPERYLNNVNENVCRDGRRVWMTWSNHAILDEHGQVSEILAVGSDVTARKQAAEALRASERRFRAIFEQAAVGIAQVKSDGSWLQINNKLCEILGYHHEELLKRSFRDITHPDDLAREMLQIERVLAGEIDSYQMEKRYLRKDGSIVWVNLTSALVRHADGSPDYAIAVVEDISERKRNRAALQAMHAEMEQLMKFQVASQTVSALAHELNQPLNAVATYAEAALRLLRAGNPQPDKLLHALESSTHQAQRAGRVVRELLEFMKKGEVQTEPLDLNELVRRVLDRTASHGYGGFQSTLELEPAPVYVRANRLQVEKVLINLIENGIEAMLEAGVSLRSIVIRVSTNSGGGLAKVTVRDRGPGINAETLHRIFDPFFTTKANGLGMGLAISRAIIESHGGQLWVDSEPDLGASFHFTLPFAS